MTRTYQVWLILRDRPQSASEIAHAHRMPKKTVEYAFSALRQRKAVTFVCRRGKEVVYQTNEVVIKPDGRGRSAGSAVGLRLGPKSRPKIMRLTTDWERKSDPPRKHGYGSGSIELERVWGRT